MHKLKGPPDVYWLDCSGTEPKLTGKKLRTGLKSSMDICHIPDKTKPLLVITDYLFSSIHVYDSVSNELEWNCEVRARNVTTDGEYVLACTNSDVRMLSRFRWYLSRVSDKKWRSRIGETFLPRTMVQHNIIVGCSS